MKNTGHMACAITMLISSTVLASREWTVTVSGTVKNKATTQVITVDIKTPSDQEHFVVSTANDKGTRSNPIRFSTTQPSDHFRIDVHSGPEVALEMSLMIQQPCDPRITELGLPFVTDEEKVSKTGKLFLEWDEADATKYLNDTIAILADKRKTADDANKVSTHHYSTVTGSGSSESAAENDARNRMPDGADRGTCTTKKDWSTGTYYATIRFRNE